MQDPEWPGCRAIAFIRDLNRCVVCGELVDDGHHREALKSGGRSDSDRHSPEKLISTCRLHHSRIHSHPEVSIVLGYIVPMGLDPAMIPVWYGAEGRTGCWFLLTAGGTRLYQQIVRPEVAL